jgi:hypothetical protein
VVVSSTVSTASGPAIGTETGFATATCPGGTKLTGGGAAVVHGSQVKGAITASEPTTAGTPTAWRAKAMAVTGTGTGNALGVIAYAICAS